MFMLAKPTRCSASSPQPKLQMKLDRQSEKRAVGIGRRGNGMLFGTCQTSEQAQLDDDRLLPVDRSFPPADELSVDDDDVRGQGVASRDQLGRRQSLADGTAILEADEVLVVVRQQVGRR